MTWAVLCINIKGGTGKTTVSEEIPYELRDRGYDVGVMDADIDSANLASRFGVDERVTFKGDHTIKPVEHDGMKIYSMENAFDDASFSQTGEFQAGVVKDMVESSDWGDLDYLVVDCPPGSSDVFQELVRALRPYLLGAVSVGQPDSLEDTARLVEVCNHSWVPIITFIENMAGVYCHGEEVLCTNSDSGESHEMAPFGKGSIKEFVRKIDGHFSGQIPLCVDDTPISEAAGDTISNIADAIEESDQPEMPEDNIGQKGFIRNVWEGISGGIKKMNDDIPVANLQEDFGVEGRDPISIKLELTDAKGIRGIFSSIVITVVDGDLKVMRPNKAKRKGRTPEGSIRISSQDLNYAINGEKKILRSATGEVTTEPYSIIDAVQMGDAEVKGERAVNRLSVLDKILSDVVPYSEIQEAMAE